MDETPLEDAVLVVRPFDPKEDSAMLFSTWRNSSYYSAASPHKKENDIYFKHLTKKISQILKTAEVKIACLEDCPMMIIGYVVSTGTHLDWIYVKQGYREKGIGSFLMPKNITSCTDAPTKLGLLLAQKLKLEFKGDTDHE